jgi:hypothetical protein
VLITDVRKALATIGHRHPARRARRHRRCLQPGDRAGARGVGDAQAQDALTMAGIDLLLGAEMEPASARASWAPRPR